MGAIAIVGELVVAVISFGIAGFAAFTKYNQVKHSDHITLRKGDKQVTISSNPNTSEKRKLVHF
jgi:hypothetical protein